MKACHPYRTFPTQNCLHQTIRRKRLTGVVCRRPRQCRIKPRRHRWKWSLRLFPHHLHPHDQAIKDRFQQVLSERAAERPTIPSTIGEELLSNLFMRSRDVEEFTHYRHSKDHWRG